jgi:propanol-preferring alcohol dehydrogenase
MPVMRAAILRRSAPVESRPLSVERMPVPEPGPGAVLIRVRACGVCRTDLHVVEGELDSPMLPLIPGHQVVGVVEKLGSDAGGGLRVGDRAGVAWLHQTCGKCRFCATGRENLCDRARFTGYTAHGGFAEFIAAPADFVYRIPEGFSDVQAAPLLCAGIIGYRALRLIGLHAATSRRPRLGIYGFGAAGHVVIQLARGRGMDVFVCTRDRERHQALAAELGAAWVGGPAEAPPERLDAAIVFAPAGEVVPPALMALDKAGVLVLGGIHMSDIPQLPYRLLYGERIVRSVANNTRADGREFLAEAARVPVRTRIEAFPLAKANEALLALKRDAVRGAAVLTISE